MNEAGIIRCTYLKNEILLLQNIIYKKQFLVIIELNVKGDTIKFFRIYYRKIS